mmetsp:Transcript_15096/g.21067  ORF Transcript_15096/g.21067 Transcript_15096/m.21067 type:complete len:83 (-) Transcript_15096:43-291(-)
MFLTRVLFGGKVWKHKFVRTTQTTKRNDRKDVKRLRLVEDWLRKYNVNPHNRQPQKIDWIEYDTSPVTPMPQNRVLIDASKL